MAYGEALAILACIYDSRGWMSPSRIWKHALNKLNLLAFSLIYYVRLVGTFFNFVRIKYGVVWNADKFA